jgi:hypothetical protein
MQPDSKQSKLAIGLALACLASMFLLHLSELTFVDPDLWHEMALFREGVTLGHLPLEDRFAYTPTVYPSVHHEWGTGAVLYLTATHGGAAGVMLLKYLLTASVWSACFYCARRRGASFAAIISLAPVTILCGVIGFTTIRAQLFTLLMLSSLLCFLDADSRGNRRWLWVWLPMFVLWVNLHAGFIVGAGLLGVHIIEQWLRGRRALHLVALELAMGALVIVNPYGLDYYPYLAKALTMDRPLITEWAPLWQSYPTMFYVYLLSLLLVCYCGSSLGWRRMPGLLVLLISAYAAARHTRHLSIYLVVWMCYVPGYLQESPLGASLCDIWQRRQRVVIACSAVLGLFCLARAVPAAPWKLYLPATKEQQQLGLPVYPVGAVDYLKEIDFHGNVMVPFVPGGYVSWKLHPQVKVSLDGRYEVAYQPGLLEESVHFYDAEPGWQQTLDKYRTDLVMVPHNTPLAPHMEVQTTWRRVYRDDTYDIYSRPGLDLPVVDRSGEKPVASFP